MTTSIGKILTRDQIAAIEEQIAAASENGQVESAWQAADQLRRVQSHQPDVAMALVRLISEQCFASENAILLLGEIKDAHAQDPQVFALVGDCLDAVLDIDDLNRSTPTDPIFGEIIERLEILSEELQGTAHEKPLLTGLSTAARLVGRQYDKVADTSYRKLLAMEPERSSAHYNLGLFLKTRGRFEEGMRANQRAAELSDDVVDCYEWNTGICATGTRNGAVALEVWQRMRQKIEMGRFGLPEGSYPQAKVRLAERPLAERNAECDDPGLEETIWIERLSPCHGIIRSVLYNDLGVDYGDVVLIDGAPVTYHKYGDEEVPVFPHLATLERRNYQYYDFAGTQEVSRQLADVSRSLPKDAIVYSHTESFRQICANCWRDPDQDHERHEAIEKHVVAGRVAAPGDLDPAELLTLLDSAIDEQEPCRIYVPDLAMAAGDRERSDVDRRRFNMLAGH